MKLTAVLLIVACLQVSANGFSQKVTIRENNISLQKVFEEIRRQTGYNFFYADEVLNTAKKVSLSVKKETVENVLDLCFSGQQLAYSISENTIVVKRKIEAPVTTAPVVAEPVATDVRGKVTDDNGQPLPGVSVFIKGTTTGVTTDANGNYSISVPEGGTLVFSYVGFGNIEEKVDGRTSINVSLKPVERSIDAVVVVGYGTQKKKDLTGSISSVKGEEVARMPSTNPVSSLQGKVAGLTISNSGRAGSSPVVRIRGVNSTSTASPVYIVDGIMVDNIDFLNPADIESFDVLKDPSSIAIYGMRAANGVIAVTTKKSARGKTVVNFQSNVSIQKVNDKIAITDAAGFKKLFQAQENNLNVAPNLRFDFTNYTANTNWQDQILQTAVMTSNNISIANSGEKSSTYLNIGYTNQEGVLKNDSYKRYLLHLKEEININKNIKVGGDITGYHATFNPPSASITHGLWAAPIFPIQQDAQTFYAPPSFQRSSISNPVATIMRNDRNSINKNYRAVGNLFAEVKFLKNFTWRSTIYGDLNFYTTRSYTRLPFKFINLGEGATPTTTTYDNSARTAVTQVQGEDKRFQQDHYLTFDKRFEGGHTLTAVAGFTTLYNSNSVVDVTARDTSLFIPNDPDLWYLGIITSPATTINAINGRNIENAAFGSFLRTAYAYKGKYLLNATIRRDGSSKFAEENRWITSGSIGLGWVVSQEDFFAKIKGIDFLKLRAAWGKLANSNGIPDNIYKPGLLNGQGAIFGDIVYPSIVAGYRPDSALTYEVVGGWDAGFDIRLLKNRLHAEVSFYNRKTDKILSSITLPNIDLLYITNLGEITNKGVEISAGWDDNIGKDFRYSVNANFSYNKNNVNSIGNGFDFQLTGNGGVNRTIRGYSIGHFFGYKQLGIYQTTADLQKNPAFTTSLPGDIMYADLNNDGVITSADRTYLGSPFPTYNFGSSISLGYKGFDLLIEGQGQAGHKIYAQRRTATFTTLNFEANRLNAWTTPGSTNVEPILDNSRGNNFLMSNYYLETGDYFRLRTLQLGYSFSRGLISKAGMQSARIYISGQNLKTWSKVTGYSPEPLIGSILGGGADNGSYPVPAVYSIGINLTF